MEAMQADKEAVIDRAKAVALKWLLDSGIGLTDEGEPDQREIDGRMEEVVATVERAWAEGLEMMMDDDEKEEAARKYMTSIGVDPDAALRGASLRMGGQRASGVG